MATPADVGPVTKFLSDLGEDEKLRETWQRDPKEAVEGRSDLSPEDKQVLLSGDFATVRDHVNKEAQASKAQAFMIVVPFMRPTSY
jgi:hypothetical protein